jgi:EAL domain-containing protein (putative c-di-GMP-specific phosphodiesterase class I)
MPLQQLVEYFNDRFEREHRSHFRPLILQAGQVNGLFGPIRVGSVFTSVRPLADPLTVIGHTVACSVATHDPFAIQRHHVDNSLTSADERQPDFDTIINLDRLTRTVHMLNYLPIVTPNSMLFLEVDPRHVVGVRRDHGAYFAEVIDRCGLATRNVVIAMSLNSLYVAHQDRLLTGLNNYRSRGYRIALNTGNLNSMTGLWELVKRIEPDYIRVHASQQYVAECILPRALSRLKELLDTAGAQTILKIERGEQAFMAQLARFDLIEGGNFDVYSESMSPEEPVADSVFQ